MQSCYALRHPFQMLFCGDAQALHVIPSACLLCLPRSNCRWPLRIEGPLRLQGPCQLENKITWCCNISSDHMQGSPDPIGGITNETRYQQEQQSEQRTSGAISSVVRV